MNDQKISPYCRNLRTKKYFSAPHPPRNAEELLEASGHCWCRVTGHAVGEDGEVCDPVDCIKGRTCFVAFGAVTG